MTTHRCPRYCVLHQADSDELLSAEKLEYVVLRDDEPYRLVLTLARGRLERMADKEQGFGTPLPGGEG